MIKYLISLILILFIFSCNELDLNNVSEVVENSTNKIEEIIENKKEDKKEKNLSKNKQIKDNIFYYVGEPYFIEGVSYTPEENYNYSEIVATFDEEITQQMNSPNNPTTATSPLMEMIVSVSNSSFLKNDASKPHYMIVVSDMIQESREFSHRRNSTDFKVWEESFRHVRGDLKESKVQLIYLNRNDDKTTQNRKHVIFWEDFFDYLNARIVAVISR